jgi:hypothetical protein
MLEIKSSLDQEKEKEIKKKQRPLLQIETAPTISRGTMIHLNNEVDAEIQFCVGIPEVCTVQNALS